MELKPKVTAIIPCHNHRKWLGDAITSILVQSYLVKSLIIVDDHSTDGSAEYVKEMIKETRMEPIIKLVENTTEKHGPSIARNIGIQTGWENTDLFAFLDSDDIYHKDKIKKSVEIFNKDPQNIGVVYSDYNTLSIETGQKYRQYKEPFSRERLIQECIVNCDSLISKRAFETCGLFDEQLRVCEDYDRWLHFSERFVICHIPEALVDIRVGSHSSTSTVKSEIWKQCYSRVMQKIQERMNGKQK